MSETFRAASCVFASPILSLEKNREVRVEELETFVFRLRPDHERKDWETFLYVTTNVFEHDERWV